VEGRSALTCPVLASWPETGRGQRSLCRLVRTEDNRGHCYCSGRMSGCVSPHSGLQVTDLIFARPKIADWALSGLCAEVLSSPITSTPAAKVTSQQERHRFLIKVPPSDNNHNRPHLRPLRVHRLPLRAVLAINTTSRQAYELARCTASVERVLSNCRGTCKQD